MIIGLSASGVKRARPGLRAAWKGGAGGQLSSSGKQNYSLDAGEFLSHTEHTSDVFDRRVEAWSAAVPA
jgi:hypothetical protein